MRRRRSRPNASSSEALSRLTATLESTADGILVVSTDGRITGSNRRFAEIWHLPEELVAEQSNAAALAFALDQLTDPSPPSAKRSGDPSRRNTRASTFWSSGTAGWWNGPAGRNG